MSETPGTGERRRGRPRAGTSGDARSAIAAAAVAEFAENGYDATSLRAVARRAGVDPALVHHYFDDKNDLLAAAIDAPLRPDKALDEILAGPRDEIGERIVRFIVGQLRDAHRRARTVALLRAALGNKPVGQLIKQFIARELVRRVAAVAEQPDGELRATLAGTQIIGLLTGRYVLELEPLASASEDQLAAWIGPTIQRYLFGAAPTS